MKKLFVLLLALTMVGAAFAADAPAVTTAIAVWGETGVYNNGTDTYLGGNNALDFDFDASTEKFGVSSEIEWIQDGTGPAVDTNLYLDWAYGWYKPISMLKIDLGYIWDDSFRLRNSMLQYVGGALINANGIAVVATPIEGLSAAVFLPAKMDKGVASGLPGYTQLFSDGIKELDVVAKYVMKDVGNFYASYEGANKNSKLGVAADLKMVPNATIQLGFYYAGMGAAATVGQDISVMTVLGYQVTKELKVTEEFNIYSNNASPEIATKAFGWLSNTTAAYRLGDVRYQLAAKVNNKRLTTNDYIQYSVTPSVRLYEGTNYFNVAFNYAGSTLSGAKATWKIPFGYSIAF